MYAFTISATHSRPVDCSSAWLAMIGTLLGHTQVQTTARYAHLASDPVKQTATKISDRLALALLGAVAEASANKARQSSTSIDNETDDAAAA
jgi:hypothetical protein